MSTAWYPSEDGMANFLRRVKQRPIGDLIRETDPDSFGHRPRHLQEHITDVELRACLTEARNIGSPNYLARKRSRINRQREDQFTTQQMTKGAEILARINEREKTA